MWAGDTLYVSGSGGRKPGADDIDPTIEGQTKQTMQNIGQILAAGGLKHQDTVFANVYFLDAEGYKGASYGKLNSVYKGASSNSEWRPAAPVPVSKLPGTISVEIAFIATRDRAAAKGRVVPNSAGPSPTSSNGGVLRRYALHLRQVGFRRRVGRYA